MLCPVQPQKTLRINVLSEKKLPESNGSIQLPPHLTFSSHDVPPRLIVCFSKNKNFYSFGCHLAPPGGLLID